jgi:hypothetical protein
MSKPSDTQKTYYYLFLLPMWRGQLDKLLDAERNYRYHLLAVECLRKAKGPGVDPLRISEFCRKWNIPLTTPLIGPTDLLRKIGKATGGWLSAAAMFDPTSAIKYGIKVMAHMGPLLGKIQMNNACLYALDNKIIPKGDQVSVLEILELSRTPQILMNNVKKSINVVNQVLKETSDLAEKMENIRLELGLSESIT